MSANNVEFSLSRRDKGSVEKRRELRPCPRGAKGEVDAVGEL